MPDPILLISLFGGLLLMALAGDTLLRGALGMARAMRVPPLVAGIVIIGFGTSAPEMFISANAALSGNAGLGFGNIVGSNIANILLVMALAALVFPFRAAGGTGQGLALFAMLLATFVWIAMTALMPLEPLMGVFFLLILIGYAGLAIFSARRAELAGRETPASEAPPGGPPLWRAIIYVPAGIAGLLWAAQLIITGGEGTARFYGVPEEWIGLTILAVGSSLPELGAALAAAVRRRGDVLVGNILGSNIFNIFGAGGMLALFGPVSIAPMFQNYDHWAMGFAALILAGLFMARASIGRLVGVLLLLIYAAYIYGLVTGVSLMGLAQLVTG